MQRVPGSSVTIPVGSDLQPEEISAPHSPLPDEDQVPTNEPASSLYDVFQQLITTATEAAHDGFLDYEVEAIKGSRTNDFGEMEYLVQ